MKGIFLTICVLVSISAFGQEWSEFQVDSLLSVSIPDNYQVKDTLGQRIIKSTIDEGLIIISVLQRTITAKSEDELIEWYKDFKNGFIPPNGQFIKEDIVDNNGLKMLRLSYGATMGGEKQIRHCIATTVNGKIYSINFWDSESMTDESYSTREKLFSSIKFPNNLGLENQLNHNVEIPRYFYGALFRRILTYLLLPGLVILVIVWITKQVRKQSTNAQH